MGTQSTWGLLFLYLNMQLAILILVAVLCKHGNAMVEQEWASNGWISDYEVPGNCQCGRMPTGNQESGDYIINGQQADKNEYPWMALVQVAVTNGIMDCGGSLISNKWMLTAAHCTNGSKASDIQVVLGLYRMSNLEYKKRWNIVEVINHPNFEMIKHPILGYIKVNFDFALLKLEEPVDFFTNQHIRPICLPTNPSCQFEGFPAITTGWGITDQCYPNEFPNELQEINLEVLSNDICKNLYINGNIPITTQSICAYVPNQGDATSRGDSGGPLIFNVGGYYELVGVTSWSNEDCLPKAAKPSVFARVTSILEWINENIKDDLTSCTKK